MNRRIEMKRPTCSTCRWFCWDADDLKVDEGRCKANPPTVGMAEDGNAFGIWPIVFVFDERCRRYERDHVRCPTTLDKIAARQHAEVEQAARLDHDGSPF